MILDETRGHSDYLGYTQAHERTSHAPRGWVTWAELYVPFLIGTEAPVKIKAFVRHVWGWHRANGLNPWLRTRQNSYADLRREYLFSNDHNHEDEPGWTHEDVQYVRIVQRGQKRWGIRDTDMGRHVDRSYMYAS